MVSGVTFPYKGSFRGLKLPLSSIISETINTNEVRLTKFQFPLIGPLDILSFHISYTHLLDNYTWKVVSHSLIRGHLGV